MAELSDLGGWKFAQLDAVDFTVERSEGWNGHDEDASVCRFRLNGVLYMATEDPSDGYRSMMRDLLVLGNEKTTNEFLPVAVSTEYFSNRRDMKGDGYDGECDILRIVDVVTGGTILEIGTDMYDDYYPSFVASFDPSVMSPGSYAPFAAEEQDEPDPEPDYAHIQDFGAF